MVICAFKLLNYLIKGWLCTIKLLHIPVRVTCDLGVMQFKMQAPLFTKTQTRLHVAFCTMQAVAGKHTAFSTHIWGVISLTTLAADHICNAF